MNSFSSDSRTRLFLYRLIIQMQDAQSIVYSFGHSIDDAFARYVANITRRREPTLGLVFIAGELANPHAPAHQ